MGFLVHHHRIEIVAGGAARHAHAGEIEILDRKRGLLFSDVHFREFDAVDVIGAAFLLGDVLERQIAQHDGLFLRAGGGKGRALEHDVIAVHLDCFRLENAAAGSIGGVDLGEQVVAVDGGEGRSGQDNEGGAGHQKSGGAGIGHQSVLSERGDRHEM